MESIAARGSDLAAVFETLYQRTIDFGAHPNERSVTANLRSEKIDPESTRYSMIYLHGGDGQMLDHGLKTVAQVGFCSLLLFQTVWPGNFDALGVRARLETLRSRL